MTQQSLNLSLIGFCAIEVVDEESPTFLIEPYRTGSRLDQVNPRLIAPVIAVISLGNVVSCRASTVLTVM